MPAIKTYNPSTREVPFKGFDIARMEDIYAQRQGKPDVPHRHDYYTVLLVRYAHGQHIIDFNAYELAPAQVFFVASGQVHQMLEAEQSEGFVLVFSEHLLTQNNIPLSFIEDLNLFNDYGQSPALALTEAQLLQLENYCAEMEQWHTGSSPFKQRAVAALMELFLIACNQICPAPAESPHQLEAGNTLLRAFKQLVEANYRQWHSASAYAEALHITPDHLNRTIKALIGKTAKEYIQSRITTAARRMLHFTDQSAKEIGYELGFSEPANFSAFFKNCTGLSPTQFRAQQ